MKLKSKLILGLGLAMVAALALAACTPPDNTVYAYIRYDKNGGKFGSESREITDRYDYSYVEGGIPLLAPGDPRRDNVAKDENDSGGSGTNLNATNSVIERAGYIFLGWYREKEPRVNEAGEEIDDYGELCSVSNRPQGYTFTGRWNFETDRCTAADFTKNDDGEYEFTLHAAWAPEYTYSFYRYFTDEELAAQKAEYEDAQAKLVEAGTITAEEVVPWPNEGKHWQEYNSYHTADVNEDFSLKTALECPTPSDETGGTDYHDVPAYAGHTITGLYATLGADGKLTDPYTGTIPHAGSIDIEKGCCENMTVTVYTDWKDGEWYTITRADQITTANFNYAGCYEIEADLDFSSGGSWNFGAGTFTGILHGNSHTISNIAYKQSNSSTTSSGGVFGNVAASAEITNISFEHVTYTLDRAGMSTRVYTGTYGLFAGTVDDEARVEGVSVEGEIHLGLVSANYRETTSDYSRIRLSLVSGNGEYKDISYENVRVVVDQVTVGNEDNGAPILGWFVKAEVNDEDGTVTVTRNEDTSADPNQ